MPTLEEVSKWSVEQIRVQIHAILPPGWVFDLQPFPDHWKAAFRTEDGTEVWAEAHWNLQYILLGAYGWLWLRREPPKGHPAWRVQPPRVLVPVHPGGQQGQNLEDLDPQYLASVYAEHHRRKG
jgi:hypothetical protein